MDNQKILGLLYSKRHIEDNGCWRFAGATNTGYGEITLNKKVWLVHRLIAEIVIGPIEGKLVLHKRHCPNRDCFNPEHLYIGTYTDNAIDKAAVGRDYNKSKTHCPQGHPYDEVNTIIWRGGRYCRICGREANRRYRAKKRVK